MRRMSRILVGLWLVLLVPMQLAHAEEERNYILTTASTGGTFYPVGGAIAMLVKVKLQGAHGIGMSSISSAGSAENVRLLQTGEAQFAIVQGLFGYYANERLGPFEGNDDPVRYRSVTSLWKNVEQFAIRSELARTGTITDLLDLKGETVALGKKNSGAIASTGLMLSNLGVDIHAHFRLFDGGYGPSATAVQDGKAVGMNTPAGAPVGAMTKLMAAMGDEITILEFTPEQAAKADSGLNLWVPHVLEAGTYPGQEKDVHTLGQANFMAVRYDVSEEDVYLITKTIYENLPFLYNIHKATKEMALEHALDGLTVPLHPGALRYYREMGVDVPAHLVGDE